MASIIANEKLKQILILLHHEHNPNNKIQIEAYYDAKIAGRIRGTTPMANYLTRAPGNVIYLYDPTTVILETEDIFRDTSIILYTSSLLFTSYTSSNVLNKHCKIYDLADITVDTLKGYNLVLQSKQNIPIELFNKLTPNNNIIVKQCTDAEVQIINDKVQINTIPEVVDEIDDSDDDALLIALTGDGIQRHIKQLHNLNISNVNDLVENINKISGYAIDGCPHCGAIIEFLTDDSNKDETIFGVKVMDIIPKFKSNSPSESQQYDENNLFPPKEQREKISLVSEFKTVESRHPENENNIQIKYKFEQILLKNYKKGQYLITLLGEIPKYDKYYYVKDLTHIIIPDMTIEEYLSCVFENALITEQIIKTCLRFRVQFTNDS